MKTTAHSKEPLLYPPLSDDLKTRMRKAGHGDMIEVLDGMTEKSIKALMRASRTGPVFSPKAGKRAAIE